MQRPLAAEDLWTKIESSPPPSSDDLPDTTVLFVGDANSGKTTLINGFLKPNVNKEPKSTFALEYQFARKKGSGSSKNVSHIWELGGDMNELKILEIPIKAKILTMTRICIVLDLSKPQNILQSLQKWIKCVREIIKMRLMEIRGAAREEEAAIRANATAPFEEHVKDASRVRPCEVPLYIVCTKYDIFKTTPVNDRRNVMQLVRFIAHYHGASVLSCSTMDSSLKEQFKGLMSAICFHTNAKSYADFAPERPVNVTAGRDDFESILLSRVQGSDGGDGGRGLVNSENDVAIFLTPTGLTKECWGRFSEHMVSAFGAADPLPEKSQVELEDGTQGTDNEFPETDVDDARAQRDIALNRYIQEAERKESLLAKMNNTSDVGEKERDQRAALDNDGDGFSQGTGGGTLTDGAPAPRRRSTRK